MPNREKLPPIQKYRRRDVKVAANTEKSCRPIGKSQRKPLKVAGELELGKVSAESGKVADYQEKADAEPSKAAADPENISADPEKARKSRRRLGNNLHRTLKCRQRASKSHRQLENVTAEP